MLQNDRMLNREARIKTKLAFSIRMQRQRERERGREIARRNTTKKLHPRTWAVAFCWQAVAPPRPLSRPGSLASHAMKLPLLRMFRPFPTSTSSKAV